MPKIYRAADVQEAVEIATGLKDAGRYDWFRGQVKTWPPSSSLFRIQSTKNRRDINFAHSRIERFLKWCGETPGLDAVANNPHAALAIAQHYGIATHLIDFTTDPGIAGFFACDAKIAPERDTESCIYCLSTAQLGDAWQMGFNSRSVKKFEGAEDKERMMVRLHEEHASCAPVGVRDRDGESAAFVAE